MWAIVVGAFRFIKASPNLMLGVLVSVAVLMSYAYGRHSYKAEQFEHKLKQYQEQMNRLNHIASELTQTLNEVKSSTHEDMRSYEQVSNKAPLADVCRDIPIDRLQSLNRAIDKARATLRSSSPVQFTKPRR